MADLDSFATSLGMELTGSDPVAVSMAVTDRHHNFYDTTHGGAVFAIADAALTVAAGPGSITLDSHLALTAATSAGDVLVAEAREVTGGRTLSTYRVTVTRSDGRVAATMTAVVQRRQPPSSSPR